MKTSYLSTAILFLVLPTLTAFGQKETEDGPVGIFQNRSEYDQFMGSVKQAAYGEGGSPELRAMVPMLNDLALQQDFGTTAGKYGTSNNSEFDLLANEKIREDLNMVDEQYEELQKLNADVQRRAAERLREVDFSDREGLIERLKEIQNDASEELRSLFIPEQLERLQQLRNQSRLRSGSLVDLLTSNPLKDELEITDQQAEKLRETEEELEIEIQKEIAKLRERARKRLLDNLNTEQQEQVEKLIGDPFEFAAPDNKRKRSRKNGGK